MRDRFAVGPSDQPTHLELDAVPEQEDNERAGFLLFIFSLVAFPALVAFAFVLSSNTMIGGDDPDQQSAALESVELSDLPEDQSAPEQPSEQTSNSSESSGPAATASTATTDESTETPGTTNEVQTDNLGESEALEQVANSEFIGTGDNSEAPVLPGVQPTSPVQTPGNGDRGGVNTPVVTSPATPDSSDDNFELAPPATTDPQDPPSTPVINPTAPSTAVTPTSPPPAPADSPGFSQRLDIGRIGETTLAMRFETTTDTNYTLLITSNGEVATTVHGTAEGNQLENITIDGLTPGTDYSVQAVLDGDEITSAPVLFRTSGGEPAAPAITAVELVNPRVVDVQSTRFEINYESNICANGSFVIRDQDGTVVGSNSGQIVGCTTRHLSIPGFWTAALTPNTTYEITITVEANGAGQGNGNIASTSLTVTTAA